jgi:ABC-type multidrug transport system ATPase subunit
MVDTMLWECRCSPQEARDRLAAFGFRGEAVFKTVSSLSGGEKSRLKLCMLMGGDINLLILDEPTNHLDIVSREWMEDALSDYGETLLFVSHDRWFIEKFATRIWAFQDGKLTDYRGSYDEYVAWRQRQALFAPADKGTAAGMASGKNAADVRNPEQPAARRGRSSEKQLQRLEKEIGRIEEKLAALDKDCEKYASDYQKLMELDEEKETLNTRLMELYEQWEALSDG